MTAGCYGTCTRCGASWTGSKTCHCCVCHVTFTAPSGFDRHRRDGQCVTPAELGLVDAGRTYPCVGWPAALIEAERFAG